MTTTDDPFPGPSIGILAQNTAHQDIILKMISVGRKLQRRLRKYEKTGDKKDEYEIMKIVHDTCWELPSQVLQIKEDTLGFRICVNSDDVYNHISYSDPLMGAYDVASLLKGLNDKENLRACPFTQEIHMSLELVWRKYNGDRWIEIDPIAAWLFITSCEGHSLKTAYADLKKAINGKRLIQGEAHKAINNAYLQFSRQDIDGTLERRYLTRQYRTKGKRLLPTHTTNMNSIKSRTEIMQDQGTMGAEISCDVKIRDTFHLRRNELFLPCSNMPQSLLNAYEHEGVDKPIEEIVAWAPFVGSGIRATGKASISKGGNTINPQIVFPLDRDRVSRRLCFKVDKQKTQ